MIIGALIIFLTFIVDNYEKEDAKENRDSIAAALESFKEANQASVSEAERIALEGHKVDAQNLPPLVAKLRVAPVQRAGLTEIRVELIRALSLLRKLRDTDEQQKEVLDLLNGQDASIGHLDHSYIKIINDSNGDFEQLPKDPGLQTALEKELHEFVDEGAAFNKKMEAIFPQIEEKAESQVLAAKRRLQNWRYWSYGLFFVGWLISAYGNLRKDSD